MTVRRTRSSRSLRLLVPAAFTAAVVFVPSAAFADTGDNPLEPVTGAAGQIVDQSGTGDTGADLPTSPIDPPAGLPDLGFPPVLGGGTGGQTPDPATQLTPTALRQLFIQALAPLGISSGCVNGVFDGFQGVISALTDQGPEQLQDLIDALVGGLTNPGSFDPSELSNSDLATALQVLAGTLQTQCMPTPGGNSGGGPVVHPPTDGYGYDEGYKPRDNGGYGNQAPAAPAPAAVAPVAAPGAYLGYAPTGGNPDEASNSVPLAALGGIVLLSAAGAAGYRVMTRGARSRG